MTMMARLWRVLSRGISQSDLCFNRVILVATMRIHSRGQKRKQGGHLKRLFKTSRRQLFGRDGNGGNSDKWWNFRNAW